MSYLRIEIVGSLALIIHARGDAEGEIKTCSIMTVWLGLSIIIAVRGPERRGAGKLNARIPSRNRLKDRA